MLSSLSSLSELSDSIESLYKIWETLWQMFNYLGRLVNVML